MKASLPRHGWRLLWNPFPWLRVGVLGPFRQAARRLGERPPRFESCTCHAKLQVRRLTTPFSRPALPHPKWAHHVTHLSPQLPARSIQSQPPPPTAVTTKHAGGGDTKVVVVNRTPQGRQRANGRPTEG